MCGIGRCGAGAQAFAAYSNQTGGGASEAVPAAPVAALGGVRAGAAAQASLGAGSVGTGVMQHVNPKNGHVETMVDRRVGGKVADRAKSQRVYDLVATLISRYPTAEALRAAGSQVKAAPKGGDHIAIPPGNEDIVRALKDSDTNLAWLVIDNSGKVISAQIDQKTSATPPTWGGVWGNHETGKAFMTHVTPGKPLDEAFDHH